MSAAGAYDAAASGITQTASLHRRNARGYKARLAEGAYASLKGRSSTLSSLPGFLAMPEDERLVPESGMFLI